MPIYEYECRSCGERFEELVGPHVGVPSEAVRCTSCGAKAVERLVSPYAPLHRQLTPTQKRRLEERRSRDRSARKAEFKRKRAAARRDRGEG
jgi:putative FmdB family regulatory protein